MRCSRSSRSRRRTRRSSWSRIARARCCPPSGRAASRWPCARSPNGDVRDGACGEQRRCRCGGARHRRQSRRRQPAPRLRGAAARRRHRSVGSPRLAAPIRWRRSRPTGSTSPTLLGGERDGAELRFARDMIFDWLAAEGSAAAAAPAPSHGGLPRPLSYGTRRGFRLPMPMTTISTCGRLWSRSSTRSGST